MNCTGFDAIHFPFRNVTKEHLSEIFGVYGALKTCEMPMDRTHPELSRGYGYVEYEKAEDAEKALKHMDGGQIDGLEIQCEMTLPFREGRGGRGSPPVRGGYRSPPRRRPSPPPRSSGANRIPIGGGGGRQRSRSRSPWR